MMLGYHSVLPNYDLLRYVYSLCVRSIVVHPINCGSLHKQTYSRHAIEKHWYFRLVHKQFQIANQSQSQSQSHSHSQLSLVLQEISIRRESAFFFFSEVLLFLARAEILKERLLSKWILGNNQNFQVGQQGSCIMSPSNRRKR